MQLEKFMRNHGSVDIEAVLKKFRNLGRLRKLQIVFCSLYFAFCTYVLCEAIFGHDDGSASFGFWYICWPMSPLMNHMNDLLEHIGQNANFWSGNLFSSIGWYEGLCCVIIQSICYYCLFEIVIRLRRIVANRR
jgi:hypothetical protein